MTDSAHPDSPSKTEQPLTREASRTHQALLAHMRHELRTPINAMLGYSEMLLEDAAQGMAEFLPDLDKIHTASAQLLARVNQWLDPASLDARLEDLDLAAFGVTLRHDLRTPINTIVGYVEMMLEDAADRIPEDVFPDLQKIHTAAQRFLTCIEDLVHLCTLPIDALNLDLQMPEASAMIHDVLASIRPLEEEGRGEGPARGGAVLIVDDNEVNRDVLARRLARQGLAVTVAADGSQALQILTTQPFDLVLLDIMMPQMNGYQVLQHLKADAQLRDIPVIMISALDEIDSVVRCIEMGAEDYLPKPFNPVLLRARIGACLEQKRLRDQEVEYLRNVAQVTKAAAAVEAGAFDAASLAGVARRRDELGQLARVFQRMAQEVQAREQRLRQQVQELRIEIDEVKKARQVAEITETDYFQQLQAKARTLRPHPRQS